MLLHTIRHKLIRIAVVAILAVPLINAASFGRVVGIGGHAADLALDEARGLLYIANYTSGRIDVMSTSDLSISRSISVPAYPGGVAITPDGHYLIVTHYASAAGSELYRAGQDAVTVLDLNSNQRRSYGLPGGPVALAIGIDGLALILTQQEFVLLNPATGQTTSLGTIANVKAQTLPVEFATFPPQILAATMTATADGKHIIGIGGNTPDTGTGSELLRFSYNVANRQITAAGLVTTAPSLAPRAISASRDGSYYMSGWALVGCGLGVLGDCTATGPLLAQWPNASGTLNVGTVAIRSSRSLIYAQITQVPQTAPPDSQTVCLPNGTCVTVSTPTTTPRPANVPPALMIMDAENLAVRERIQLAENLAGKSVFNEDESVLYSISDSGVTVFPMAQLDRAPRVVASVEDVVFRGNFCNTGPVSQEIEITDPSRNSVQFAICVKGSAACAAPPGVTFSPSAGVTPARVKITIDPAAISSLIGTKAFEFEIRSGAAVNMPRPPTRGRVETDYVANTRSRFRVLVNNREPENRGAFFNSPGDLVDIVADPARNRFYVLRQDTNQVLVYDAVSYSLITTLKTGNTPTSLAITFDRRYLLAGNNDSNIVNRYDLDTLRPLAPILMQIGHYPRSIAVSGRAILAASRVAGTVHTIDLIDLASGTGRPLPTLGPYKNDVHISTTLTGAPNGATIMGAMPDGRVLLYNANVDTFTIARKEFTSLKGGLAASSFGSYTVDHYLLNESLVAVASVVTPGDSPAGFAFVEEEAYAAAVSAGGRGYMQRLSIPSAQAPLPTTIVENPLVGDTEYPFRRTLAPLANRAAFIALTTSGFTVLPWDYDAFTAPPVLDRVVNAADFTRPVAPGGLVSIFGRQLSPMTLARTDTPLPTVLADSCLTVNGVVVPVSFVSPAQINAQLPFQVDGNAEAVLRTPGGISDAMRFTILPVAPSIFRFGTAGPETGIPAIYRAANNDLATISNPIHPDDRITIYLTGLGQTSPQIPAGEAATADPLSRALVTPVVTLGGVPLFVEFAGLTPGFAGVYQINAAVPFRGIPTGFEVPLTIQQGGLSTTVLVRVVN